MGDDRPADIPSDDSGSDLDGDPLVASLALPGPYDVTLGVTLDSDAWRKALPDVETLVVRAMDAALRAGDPSGLEIPFGTSLEVSVVLSTDDALRALNREYRGKDTPTNVLSFAALDDGDPTFSSGVPVMLGDVIIAFETTVREADDRGISVSDHVFHLTVHGALHLLGYDHMDEDEATEMEDLETAVLAAHGIADPHGLTDERTP